MPPLPGLAPLHPSEGRTRRALVLPSRTLLRAFGRGQWASSPGDGRGRLCSIDPGESFSRDRMPRTERVAVAEIRDALCFYPALESDAREEKRTPSVSDFNLATLTLNLGVVSRMPAKKRGFFSKVCERICRPSGAPGAAPRATE